MRYTFLLAIMLIGSFAFANNFKNGENNAPKSDQSTETSKQQTLYEENLLVNADPCASCPEDCCGVFILKNGR